MSNENSTLFNLIMSILFITMGITGIIVAILAITGALNFEFSSILLDSLFPRQDDGFTDTFIHFPLIVLEFLFLFFTKLMFFLFVIIDLFLIAFGFLTIKGIREDTETIWNSDSKKLIKPSELIAGYFSMTTGIILIIFVLAGFLKLNFLIFSFLFPASPNNYAPTPIPMKTLAISFVFFINFSFIFFTFIGFRFISSGALFIKSVKENNITIWNKSLKKSLKNIIFAVIGSVTFIILFSIFIFIFMLLVMSLDLLS